MHNFEIALRILSIAKLCANFEIAYAILKSCNESILRNLEMEVSWARYAPVLDTLHGKLLVCAIIFTFPAS